MDCLCSQCYTPDRAGVWFGEGRGIGEAAHAFPWLTREIWGSARGLWDAGQGVRGLQGVPRGAGAGCRGGCRGGRLSAHKRWVQMQVGIPTYTIGGFKPAWSSRCAQFWGADVRWVPKPVGAKAGGCLQLLWSARVCLGQAGAVTRVGFSLWCRAGFWVLVQC